jgi:hypothetical protein
LRANHPWAEVRPKILPSINSNQPRDDPFIFSKRYFRVTAHKEIAKMNGVSERSQRRNLRGAADFKEMRPRATVPPARGVHAPEVSGWVSKHNHVSHAA